MIDKQRIQILRRLLKAHQTIALRLNLSPFKDLPAVSTLVEQNARDMAVVEQLLVTALKLTTLTASTKRLSTLTAPPAQTRTLGATKLEQSTEVAPSSLPRCIAAPKPKVAINFIWLGSPIPAEYLRNIMQMVAAARRSDDAEFQVQLWLDKASHCHQTATIEEINTAGLKTRLIEELYPNMRKASVYAQIGLQYFQYKKRRLEKTGAAKPGQKLFGLDPHQAGLLPDEHKRIFFSKVGKQLFKSFLTRELHGLCNFAAASDLLRLEILRQEAGYYLDTDRIMEFPPGSKLSLDTAEEGLLLHIDKDDRARHFNAGIDLMYVAQPDCTHINSAIALALSNYIRLDIKHNPAERHRSFMDYKRGSDFLRSFYATLKPQGFTQADRISLTLSTSGLLFTEQTLCSTDETSRFAFPVFRHRARAGEEAKPNGTLVMGLFCATRYDNTWTEKTRPEKSFECHF